MNLCLSLYLKKVILNNMGGQYSDSREFRKAKALEWHSRMQKEKKSETGEAVKNSVIYRDSVPSPSGNSGKPKVSLFQGTVHDWMMKNIKTCPGWGILNFASYRNPGGGFLNGSKAQEEDLCHYSNLYEILSSTRLQSFYMENQKNEGKLRNGMYTDAAIYTPGVSFFECGVWVSLNVLTCPAPNVSKYPEDRRPVYYENVLYKRIKFILDIFEATGNKKLVLGAFGCGVFKNPPSLVASTFKKLLDSGQYSFTDIIFAVPAGPNYTVFSSIRW